MLLEILNSTKEIYIAIYTILSLSAICQAAPDLVKQYSQQIHQVLKKILSAPGGLDDSSLLYCGHLMLSLIDRGVIDGDLHRESLLVFVHRMAKTKVPSATKVSVWLLIIYA